MFATCAIGGIHYGTGRHMTDLDPEDAMKAMRVSLFHFLASPEFSDAGV